MWLYQGPSGPLTFPQSGKGESREYKGRPPLREQKGEPRETWLVKGLGCMLAQGSLMLLSRLASSYTGTAWQGDGAHSLLGVCLRTADSHACITHAQSIARNVTTPQAGGAASDPSQLGVRSANRSGKKRKPLLAKLSLVALFIKLQFP